MWTSREKEREHKVTGKTDLSVGHDTISLKRHTLLFTLRRNTESSPYTRLLFSFALFTPEQLNMQPEIWIKQTSVPYQFLNTLL